MNILRKTVKEVLLMPLRVIQGGMDAMDEAVNGPKDPPKPPRRRQEVA